MIFVARMLDFDTLCGRKMPSVAAVINPTGEATFAKFLFGSSNVLIPVPWSPWVAWGGLDEFFSSVLDVVGC